MRAAAIALLIGTVSAGAALARPTSPPALPDFTYSVYARNNFVGAALCVARNGDARSGQRLAGLGYYQGASWSPDGGRVAVAVERRSAGRGIRVLPASGGAFRAASKPRATEVDSEPNWSPDGTRIAFSRYVFYGPGHDYRRFGLWVVDAATRAERHFSNALPNSGNWSPTDWSPSGDRLAVRFSDGLSLFTADGRLLWTISRGPQRIGDIAWAPTGDVVAGDFGREVLLVSRDGNVVQSIVRPEIGDAELQAVESGLSWSPDGRRLAVGGGIVFDRGGLIVERYASPSTRKRVSFDPRWSPDGTAIVFDQAPAVYTGNRYGQVLTRGVADLFAFAVGSSETSRLTATANVNESDVRFRPASAGPAGKATPCMREGTAGRDVIHGTGADDLVDAGSGDDVVDGRGGDDVIVGGAGADLLVGGPGRDDLWGERGNDRLRARDGSRDTLHGGAGRDRAWIDRRDSVFGVELVSPRSAHR